MKINVYFRNANKEERLLATVEKEKDANKVINDFLAEHNFKSYYMRKWIRDDGRVMVDVGSHSEFFILEDVK